ncbi:MAG: GDYXXLXY domain-containing protein [Victivallaceae bacterium]|nr:GDYXXLXY domain-containing protein [Victivallaceae bacterium]
MNKIRLIAFLLTVIAGMAYPVYKIIKIEYPEQVPSVYRFRCGAIDPYDPFRGRFVTLRTLPDRIPADQTTYHYGENVYATLGVDSDRMATVVSLSKTPPASEFITVKYKRRGVAFEDNETIDRKKQWHFFELPFKRFHLNEKHAPEAEKIVASLTHSDTKQCVLKVKVYADGNAVIEDLEIKGQSLQKYLQNKTK